MYWMGLGVWRGEATKVLALASVSITISVFYIVLVLLSWMYQVLVSVLLSLAGRPSKYYLPATGLKRSLHNPSSKSNQPVIIIIQIQIQTQIQFIHKKIQKDPDFQMVSKSNLNIHRKKDLHAYLVSDSP